MLRATTASLHADVDARFSTPFDAGRNGYVAFLTALARAVRPLEAALEAGGTSRLLPDWPLRRRSAELERDLAILGAPVPAPLAVEVTDEEARLFGRLYVLEGSRLGGHLLARRASAHADPLVRMATNYLGHGAGADLWGGFLQRLEDSQAAAASFDRAVLGAREAFGLFMADRADV